MSSKKAAPLQEILPKTGLVVSEKGNLTEVLCKPKLLPLKSVTLQKLEEMEAKALELAQKQAQEIQPTAVARPATRSQSGR